VVESVYSAVRTDCLYKADLYPWWKVFTARYGLIPYIKQIYNRGGKRLQRGKTDLWYKADYACALKG
jgi:hypothetical protein